MVNRDRIELLVWVIQRQYERCGREIGEQFDRGGIEHIIDHFFSNVAEDFQDTLIDGLSEGIHFNDYTDGWPRLARAHLAAKDLETRDEFHDADFEVESRWLAQKYNLLDSDDEDDEDREYEDPYSRNPFDDSLNEDSALMVILLRAMEFNNVERAVDMLYDFEDFTERLLETEDVAEAIKIHQYGEVPNQLAYRLPPPEEWPDDFQTEDIERTECASCATSMYKVYYQGEVCYTDGSANLQEPKIVTEDDETELYPHPDANLNSDKICTSCTHRAQSFPNYVVRVGEGNISRVKAYTENVYKDRCYDSGVYTPARNIVEHDRIYKELALEGHNNMDEVVEIHPNPNVGDRETQRKLLEEISEGDIEEALDGGVFYLLYDPRGSAPGFGDEETNVWTIFVRRTEIESARRAKSLLEGAEEIVA